jgi:hypothetical protein
MTDPTNPRGIHMSAVPYESHEEDWETTEQEAFAGPGRPRRRFFNRKSAALAAVITCAAGFYAGIRVEKSQLGSTASAATTSATGAAAGARPGTAGGGAAAVGAGAAGGFGARFGGGAGGGGGNASLGTISSVSGNTIYLTDSSGNTVKVTLSSTTKLTKSLGVSKGSLHPGDSVVIQGVKNSNGTLVATSVSDTGARTTGTGSGAGGTASGSSSSSSTTGG